MPYSAITKRALAQAMKDLMREQPFAKISVGDICAACGMNRKSFYYHFKDKYDLVNWIFDSEFLKPARDAQYKNFWDFMRDMCSYFYQEQDFFRCALQITGQNCFHEHFIDTVSPVLLELNRDVFEGVNHVHFFTSLVNDALLTSVIRWLTDGAQITPQEYLDQLRLILINHARHVLRELENTAETAISSEV